MTSVQYPREADRATFPVYYSHKPVSRSTNPKFLCSIAYGSSDLCSVQHRVPLNSVGVQFPSRQVLCRCPESKECGNTCIRQAGIEPVIKSRSAIGGAGWLL